MKIEPKSQASFVNHNAQANAPIIGAPGAKSSLAQENRARAIEAFNKAAQLQTPAPAAPVQNPSNVSPEEMTGIKSSIAVHAPEVVESAEVNTIVEEATSPPPAKVEEPLSPHYAVLARKEKALRAEVQKLNASKAAFKAEQEALKTAGPAKPTFDESKYIPKDRITQDPVAVFEELGFSTEDIANRLLNPTKSDPTVLNLVSKLQAEIAALKAAQDTTQKTFQDSQTEAYTQAITAMEYEAEDLVNTDPEFATIKETGQSKEIVNLIKDVHEKGLPGKYRKGTLLSVEQAARLVEDELVNQWVEQHEKLSRLEKIQKRLKPATPVAKQSQPQGTQTQQSSATENNTKTLTNSMGSTKRLSARDRAIAVFNGNK